MLFPCQADRDAVIAVYVEHGEDHRVKASEIHAKKVVLEKSFNQSIAKETGIEIEKGAFIRKYGHDKEKVKQAKWTTIRKRDFKTGKINVVEVTYICAQYEGERLYEHIEGTGTASERVIDSGMFNLTEDQQDRVEAETAQLLNSDMRSSGSSFRLSALAPEETDRALGVKRKPDSPASTPKKGSMQSSN